MERRFQELPSTPFRAQADEEQPPTPDDEDEVLTITMSRNDFPGSPTDESWSVELQALVTDNDVTIIPGDSGYTVTWNWNVYKVVASVTDIPGTLALTSTPPEGDYYTIGCSTSDDNHYLVTATVTNKATGMQANAISILTTPGYLDPTM